MIARARDHKHVWNGVFSWTDPRDFMRYCENCGIERLTQFGRALEDNGLVAKINGSWKRVPPGTLEAERAAPERAAREAMQAAWKFMHEEEAASCTDTAPVACTDNEVQP